ncbi:hypothetical protein ACFWBX_27315 [Streptomyces sp. NPDC059991]|uniref:hypothetical protein n=1 Tax=Streptomyces sp. NPDC059991 TaxID=3347028 RepID=UPI00369FF866
MATDFRQLTQLARALGLSYQQLLARYHARQGPGAPYSGAIAWARLELRRVAAARAQQALRTGFADSQVRHRDWAPHAFSLGAGVLARLAARAEADRAVLPRICPGHYLDAALRTAPRHLPRQLAHMRGFLPADGAEARRNQRITLSIGAESRTMLSTLRITLAAGQLPSSQPAVVSGLAAHFLSQLPGHSPHEASSGNTTGD